MEPDYAVKVAAAQPIWISQLCRARLMNVWETINAQMYLSPGRQILTESCRVSMPLSRRIDLPSHPLLSKSLAEALRVSELTDGAFDVTVGPLIQLWGFDREGQPDKIPTQQQIDVAQQQIGFEKLEFRTDPPALRKQSPDLYVNLSAIAKGYGVDVIAEYLESVGVQDYLVEIGGEVRAKGAKPDGIAWVIGIERPDSATFHEPILAIQPQSMGMATSGNYRNFFTRDGKTYSHTIDPQTGRPVESKLVSVTVLAPTCMQADATATAIMVLGAEQGMQLAEQENLPVMLLVKDGAEFTAQANAAFQQLEFDQQPDQVAENPMIVYFATLSAFVLALVGMAIGVIISNRRIKGSCGGLNNFKDEQGNSICDSCTTPPEECDRVRDAVAGGEGQDVVNQQGNPAQQRRNQNPREV